MAPINISLPFQQIFLYNFNKYFCEISINISRPGHFSQLAPATISIFMASPAWTHLYNILKWTDDGDDRHIYTIYSSWYKIRCIWLIIYSTFQVRSCLRLAFGWVWKVRWRKGCKRFLENVSFSFSQTAERESKGRRYQRFIRFLGVEKNNTYINIKEPRHL